tara:strand:- start:287 stop:535 length:249 start_codon:yes stop_codon:yes gene_type:complete
MKEQDLIDLGFERYDASAEESGDFPFYYYTYDITDELCLISGDDGKAKKEGWSVEMFDYDGIKFTSIEDLKTLINVIEKNKL